jgi:hypothetical protein
MVLTLPILQASLTYGVQRREKCVRLLGRLDPKVNDHFERREVKKQRKNEDYLPPLQDFIESLRERLSFPIEHRLVRGAVIGKLFDPVG